MLRSLSSARLLLSTVLFAGLTSTAGCQYGNGSPCEIDRDCASGMCCGATASVRGVCRPVGDVCVVATTDAGGDLDAPDTGPIDTGIDTGDTGVEDTGVEDTGVDGGTDAGDDAGADAPEFDSGIDAG